MPPLGEVVSASAAATSGCASCKGNGASAAASVSVTVAVTVCASAFVVVVLLIFRRCQQERRGGVATFCVKSKVTTLDVIGIYVPCTYNGGSNFSFLCSRRSSDNLDITMLIDPFLVL